MNKNRIGDACWYCHNQKARTGVLRMWAQEGNLSDGIAPVAVIEDAKTYHVTTVHVIDVSFASIPPWPVERGGVTE